MVGRQCRDRIVVGWLAGQQAASIDHWASYKSWGGIEPLAGGFLVVVPGKQDFWVA